MELWLTLDRQRLVRSDSVAIRLLEKYALHVRPLLLVIIVGLFPRHGLNMHGLFLLLQLAILIAMKVR